MGHVVPRPDTRAIVSIALPAAAAWAQTATVSGSVRDTASNPVPFAQVFAGSVATIADTAGRFTIAGLPLGRTTLAARRMGFTPTERRIELSASGIDTVLIVLTALPRELAAIQSQGRLTGRLAEFERHRVNGMGMYLDRAELTKRRTSFLSDVLRRLPGTRIVTDRMGRTHVRMGRTQGGRDCPPDFWIDGVRAPMLGVDDIPLQDIEALEVYRGPSGLPPEFNNRMGNPSCGAIVIWTRVPG
jgi:hypothetical protein